MNSSLNFAGVLSVPVGAQAQNLLTFDSRFQVIEGAAGNLPDKESLYAAQKIKEKIQSLTGDDIALVLITGGGSALLPLPTEPITLDEKFALIKSLSRAGATINELNTVRIAISQVKGGKLAAMGRNAHKIVSLIVSDIIGDPLELIASGPTIPYQKPLKSPREILESYGLFDTLPKSIAEVLRKNEENQEDRLDHCDAFLIGNNRIAIDKAMNEAARFNLIPVFLSSEVQGNVVDVSQAFFQLAVAVQNFKLLTKRECVENIENASKTLSAQANFVNDLVAALEADTGRHICIISGGETTVTVSGDGLGGRNQELALRFTKLCHDANTSASSPDDLLFLSAGTDGVDGNNDAAGSLGGPRVLSSVVHGTDDKTNISAIMQDFIHRNDSYSFYKNFLKNYAGDRYQLFTGHTGTNVMDIQLLIVMPKAKM